MNPAPIDNPPPQAKTATPAPARLFRQRIKDGLVALSLANLCFFSAWYMLLYDVDHGFYNRSPLTLSALLALAANMFWFASLAWLVLRWLRRSSNKWLHLLFDLLLFVLLLMPLNFWRWEILLFLDYRVLM